MAMFSAYCKSCGLCCKRPFILPEEAERIGRKLGLSSRKFLRKTGRHFIIDADPCPFLTDKGCSIEEEKPACCSVFPLVLEPDGRGFRWVVSEECPLKRHATAKFLKKAEAEGRRLLEYHEKDVLNRRV